MSDTNTNGSNGATAVQVYQQVQYKPVRTTGNLKALLQVMQSRVRDILPQHVTPEKMMKLALMAFNRQPKLYECTGASIVESILRSAELGLDCSGSLGESYLVPYYNSREKRLECQLIVGYKGLAKLARQSGEISRIEAEVVYANDHFVYQKGSDFKVEFRPLLRGERGEKLGAYALAEFKEGGYQAVFMSVDDLEKVRAMSQMGNAGPWKEHREEMDKKTAWRNLSKWTPLSSERYQRALELSDREFEKGITYEQAHIQHGGGEDINSILQLPESGASVDNEPKPSELTDEEREEYEAQQGLELE